MYKLLVSDLDGTMFDGSMVACENNISSIKKAIDKGVIIVIATGRGDISSKNVSQQLGINKKNQFTICFNGARVVKADTNEVVLDTHLEHELARHIIKESKKFNVDSLAYIDGQPYCNRESDHVNEYGSQVNLKITVDEGFEDKITAGYNKVLIKGENKELKMVEEALRPWATDKLTFFYSSEKLLEYVSLGVSKGRAMLGLAEKLGIKKEEIVAMGDYFNDIDMIKYAGLGVAIKGSPAEILNTADYVTENSAASGAVSEVLEKFFLS